MNKRKFERFTNQELLELLATFQSCQRDNKTSRKLFEELEKEIEIRHSE